MKTSGLIFDIGTPARVDLDAVLATAERCDPYFYSIALDGAAERSRTEGDATLADTLNLLSLAMQPMLDATSDDQPFRPILEVEGRRSILPQDFTTEHTRSFASTLGNIGDPELRARLADIVWLRRADLVDRREGVEAARSAVEAYLAAVSVQEASGKFVEVRKRLGRATRLARAIDPKGRDLRSRAEMALVEVVRRVAAAGEHGWLRLLHDTLHGLRVGDPREMAALFGQASETVECDPEASPTLLQGLLDSTLDWRRRAGDKEGERATLSRTADVLARRADRYARDGDYLVAIHWMEQALVVLRRLPTPLRGGREEGWRRELRQWQPRAREAAQIISVPMDIGDLVSYSERAVSGKDLIEALVTLTTLIVPTDPEKIREQTLAIQGKSISSNLFPMTLFDNQGKTIKHVPYLSSEDPKEREVALHFHIIQSTNQRQDLNAHGLIEPARRVIMREHRCGEPELLGLVRHSPFVPGGRERMWARGLAAGFAGDFSLSTHLLLPQIEHGLRELVRAQGVDVARFDKFGQQEDWNLSQLLLDESCGRPHCERILGEALAFDLQALLVEPVGFNLRNRVAHGLVEEGEFEAGPYRYLFWLALYLCLKPLVFAMGKDRAETADGDQASEGATPPDKPS